MLLNSSWPEIEVSTLSSIWINKHVQDNIEKNIQKIVLGFSTSLENWHELTETCPK